MRLLILTQTLDSDDPTLGFFHSWVEAFASQTERVTVVCLGAGHYTLPANVEVRSLGKERGVSRLRYILRFYRYVWTERRNYDAVFVHMNPEYVILGAPLWKLLDKRVMLWYAHRSVDAKLRLAEKLTDVVATSIPNGFRLTSKKVRVVGQGIDTDALAAQGPDLGLPLVVTHVGRVTPIKHIDIVLRAVRALIDRGVSISLVELVGEPVTLEDCGYKTLLEGLARTLGIEDIVSWKGGIKSAEIPGVYKEASLTVNAAPDGAIDKTALESLAASRPVFISNTSFRDIFGVYWPQFSYQQGSAIELAQKIEAFLGLPESERRTAMRNLNGVVRAEYDISALVERILALFDR